MAGKAAKKLEISAVDNHKMIEFPGRNRTIGRDEFGNKKGIYHLSVCAQYDSTQLRYEGECYVFTVAVA